MKILIVDDETHIRLIIKAYLAPYKVEIIEARNGKEALEILREAPVDLVVLDYTMPVMSGQEVLNQMFLDEELNKIPVIIYTAGGFEEEIKHWLKTSSAAFIEKSNLVDDLIPTIKDIVGDRLLKS